MSRFPAKTFAGKSTSPSQAIEDSKKRSSLLKDGSWIRKADEEDEDVDRDPNYAKSILGRYKADETVTSSETEEVKTTKTTPSSTSVQALTKRFSGSQDALNSSSPTSTRPSYTRSTSSSLKPDSPTSSSKTTTTVTKDGDTTETTTVTTTQSVRSPVIKSPTRTTFTERVQSTSKGYSYAPRSSRPTETTTVTTKKDVEDKVLDSVVPPSPVKKDSKSTVSTTETVVVRSSPDTTEDKLFDTLIPRSLKDEAPESRSKVTSTETVTVKSSTNGDPFKTTTTTTRTSSTDPIKTTTTTRTSSTTEDDLYGTLLPRAISSPISSSITKREVVTVESSRGETPALSPSSSIRTTSYSSYPDDVPSSRTTSYTLSSSSKSMDDYNSDRSYSSLSRPNSSYEYSSSTSPSSYTSTSTTYRSRSEENLVDPIYSKSSSLKYSSSERPVLEKDLCTSCRKPFIGDAKIVLDEMKINCHASCFKCEVCNGTLAHLKAGDSMWIYRRMVHCENCFEVTREKWRR